MPNSANQSANSSLHGAFHSSAGSSGSSQNADTDYSVGGRAPRIAKVRKRQRVSTHRYEQLRRSQQKLAWCIAAGIFIGTLVGFGIGNVPIGMGTGLALGMAVGVLAAS